jgi:hypothetical protein
VGPGHTLLPAAIVFGNVHAHRAPCPAHACACNPGRVGCRVLIQDTNKRTVQDIKGRLATVTDLPGNGWVMAQLDGGEEAPFRIQQRQAVFDPGAGGAIVQLHTCDVHRGHPCTMRVWVLADAASAGAEACATGVACASAEA